jgi:hypothetical protein
MIKNVNKRLDIYFDAHGYLRPMLVSAKTSIYNVQAAQLKTSCTHLQ